MKLKNILYRINKLRPRVMGPINNINDVALKFLRDPRSLSVTENNLESISFDNNEDYLSDIKSCFNENGIVVINFFLCDELVSKVLHELAPLLEKNASLKYKSSKNEAEFRKHIKSTPNKLLLNYRDINDSGMLDIYNFDDFLSESNKQELKSVLNGKIIQFLLKEKNKRNEFKTSLNCYYNKAVESTRGFHADAFHPVIKGMIYLTDVHSIDDGCYCYVKKTHNENGLTDLNKKFSHQYSREYTESPIIDVTEITPVLGGAGTLIFSDQAGYHRGLPQKPNSERKLLVAKYISM